MASLSNTPTGTGGSIVTTGNSAAGGSAWSLVTIGTGGSLVYDDLSGTTWYRFGTGGTSAMARAEWASISPTWPRSYGRVYFTIPAATIGSVIFNLVRGRAAASQLFRIGVSTGRLIAIRNAANGAAATGGVTIVGDTVYRVEWDITIGAVATGVAKLYLGDSTTELETITATGANFGAADVTEVGYGIASATVNHPTYWLRGFEANNVAMPGPQAGGSIVNAAAALAAATTLTATAVRSTAGASTLTAAASLTAAAVAVRPGASTLSATSELTGAAVLTTTGAAALAATAALTGTPTRAVSAATAIGATSSLTAAATRVVHASADLVASSNLTAEATTGTTTPGALTAGTSRATLTAGSSRPRLRTHTSRG